MDKLIQEYKNRLIQKRYSINTQNIYINYFIDFYNYFKRHNLMEITINQINICILNLIKNVTPYMLRHSFAAHLPEQETDLRYIQELLGHNSFKTTEIYTHVSKKAIDKIKNTIDDLFE